MSETELTDKHAPLSHPNENGMTQGCSFLLFVFFFFPPLGCVLAHTKHCESPRAPGAAQGPRVLPSSLVSLSGRAGAGGSRRRPLPAQAAGPSLSGEPSGS